MNEFKKLISVLLSLIMVLSLFTALPFAAEVVTTDMASASATPDEPTEATPDDPTVATPDEPTGATPDDATPDDATPDDATPDEATPDDATPDEATPDEPDTPTPSTTVLGDADGNGTVDISDATVIQRKLARLEVKSFSEKGADADQDGKITIVDATIIQRHLARLLHDSQLGKVITE